MTKLSTHTKLNPDKAMQKSLDYTTNNGLKLVELAALLCGEEGSVQVTVGLDKIVARDTYSARDFVDLVVSQ